jgi:hypothetical protein
VYTNITKENAERMAIDMAARNPESNFDVYQLFPIGSARNNGSIWKQAEEISGEMP